MEKIALIYSIKQVVGVTVPVAISTLEFYDVGFHHQLVFLVWESTVCVWFDLLDFISVLSFDCLLSDFRTFD